jgi:hypothetical protein
MKTTLIGAAVLLSLLVTVCCNPEAYDQCIEDKLVNDPAEFLQNCMGIAMFFEEGSEPNDEEVCVSQ